MTTRAKRQFKRFENFYKKGELQRPFIDRLKTTFEGGLKGESGVVKSYFDYCEEKYGKIEQPQIGAYDILVSSEETNG